MSVEVRAVDALSVLIFRLGTRWLALPTSVCREVAEKRAIHTLPHRREGMLLGVVNIRGEIRLCISLSQCLGLAPSPIPSEPESLHRPQRLLVVVNASEQWVILVDEIHGTAEFPAGALQLTPMRTATAIPRCVQGSLAWQAQEVGYLDPICLFAAFHSIIV